MREDDAIASETVILRVEELERRVGRLEEGFLVHMGVLRQAIDMLDKLIGTLADDELESYHGLQ